MEFDPLFLIHHKGTSIFIVASLLENLVAHAQRTLVAPQPSLVLRHADFRRSNPSPSLTHGVRLRRVRDSVTLLDIFFARCA